MIAVLTCQRAASYIDGTVRQLAAQGVEARVFSDGQTDAACAHETMPKRGQVASVWAIMERAARSGEDLVLFEDDIELTDGAAPYIADFPVPDDVAMVQFCSTLFVASATWMLARIPTRSMSWMFQAIKLPLRSLRALVTNPPRDPSNCLLPNMFLPAGERAAVHVPHLVRHIGKVSALRPGQPGMLTSENFLAPPLSADNLRSAVALGLYR